MTILAVTGLKREARIAGGDGISVVIGGGNENSLFRKLNKVPGRIHGVISIGIAGGLAPELQVGDAVIGAQIVAPGEIYPCDCAWIDAIAACVPGARIANIAGSSTMLTHADAKEALYRQSGALAVDMESLVAARFAAARELPFATLRVISDDARRGLPPAAKMALKPDGGIALGAVLASLLANPAQIPALIRTARESERAFAELLRCRDLCGAGLACPYL